MKKYLFYLFASAGIVIGGSIFYACDDEIEYSSTSNSPTTTGVKTIMLNVIDEHGSFVTSKINISKDGIEQTPITVYGNYLLDVSDASSNSTFTFSVDGEDYIHLKKESITLNYDYQASIFKSYMVLYVTKKGMPVAIDPSMDTTFELAAFPSSEEKIGVNIPAGSTDMSITMTPTVVATPTSRGMLEVEPLGNSNSIALQVIDLKSEWAGNFLNGKMVVLSFPLSQGLIDLSVEKGIKLVLGTNSDGKWESYPVSINAATKTATVSVPHFATWYLLPDITINGSLGSTSFETMEMGECNVDFAVTFTKQNQEIPEFYSKLLGWNTLPEVTSFISEMAQVNHYWQIKVYCSEKIISIPSLGVSPYTYYTSPVSSSSTLIECMTGNENGGVIN